MWLWFMKLCTLLVALFGKYRDLKYSVSPLEVHKSCSINFKTRTCIVPTHTRFLRFGLERKPMSMLRRMTSIVHLSHNARIIYFSSELSKKSPSIVRQRIFSTINPPGLYVILTVYTTIFLLHSHSLTIEQVCFLLREEQNAGWERFVSGTTK
jgi:hypothetical protein